MSRPPSEFTVTQDGRASTCNCGDHPVAQGANHRDVVVVDDDVLAVGPVRAQLDLGGCADPELDGVGDPVGRHVDDADRAPAGPDPT